MDLFLTTMQLLTSQDINCWTVDYCDVFISGLDSDGTHSIHWWESDVMITFFKSSDEETISSRSWMARGQVQFQPYFNF